ncbi:MAG: hypothetical protein ACREN0_09405, partial [Thermodesulfobacteriota bacterium]
MGDGRERLDSRLVRALVSAKRAVAWKVAKITHVVWSFEKTRKKQNNIIFFFVWIQRSKNHPTTELAKNLMYSLNLPIPPQPV